MINEREQLKGVLPVEARCTYCVQQGWPEHFGSLPRCGWNEDGTFRLDNWNCALINKLSELADTEEQKGYGNNFYSDDQNLRVYAKEGRFLLNTRYKLRGRCEILWVINGIKIFPCSINDALWFVGAVEGVER